MDHAATVHRLYERMCAGDVDGIGELIADSFVEHEAFPGLEPTKEGTLQLFRMMIAAFPDLRFDPEDTLTSGDKVVARARVTGTNQGDFMGMPATGKGVNVQAIDILRLSHSERHDEPRSTPVGPGGWRRVAASWPSCP